MTSTERHIELRRAWAQREKRKREKVVFCCYENHGLVSELVVRLCQIKWLMTAMTSRVTPLALNRNSTHGYTSEQVFLFYTELLLWIRHMIESWIVYVWGKWAENSTYPESSSWFSNRKHWASVLIAYPVLREHFVQRAEDWPTYPALS